MRRDEGDWNSFLADLVARGLGGVRLVTRDAHAGLVEAIAANLPGEAWQRCRAHYDANLISVTPKSMWPVVKVTLHSVYDQTDKDAVHGQFDRLLDNVPIVRSRVTSPAHSRPTVERASRVTAAEPRSYANGS